MRTPEEFEAAKAVIEKEYGSLRDWSMFGGDNRGSQKLVERTLERLQEGEDPQDLQDEMYDGYDKGNQLESGYDSSVQLCSWAMGEQEGPLGGD